MTNYISLRSILRAIPKPLFDYSDEHDFLSWALDAYRESKLVSMYEPNIKIFEIVDKKVKLPSDIKEINLVTYLVGTPTDEDITSLSDCICNPESMSNESDTNNTCDYTIAYKMFLNSPYYNKNYAPLQYKGNSSTLICKNCPNKWTDCQNIFTVDSNKTLHTNLCDGYLCIDYDTEVKDEDGNILIPDWPELRQYLVFYAIAKHWEERSMMSEQNSGNMAQDYLVKAEIYLRKVKGLEKLRSMNANSIALLQGGDYTKLIKLPEQYVFSR